MAGGERRQVRVEYWKWGGRPHYQLSMARLGEDEFGVWLWALAGNVITKGDHWFRSREPTIGLVPRQGMWAAMWWVGHDEVEVYVNINTTPEWHDDGVARTSKVSMIDLDLDVVRLVDGRVEVLDCDEFDEHRVEYGYPPDVVDAAVRAAEEVRALVATRTEPFDVATHRRWLAVAEVAGTTEAVDTTDAAHVPDMTDAARAAHVPDAAAAPTGPPPPAAP